MKKQSLSKTNPYLKDSAKRRVGLIKFVTSSSAIEGIQGTLVVGNRTRAKKGKSISSQRASKNVKSHR